MEFSELVRARRSIRRYQEKPVPKELLRELLETVLDNGARLAEEAFQ